MAKCKALTGLAVKGLMLSAILSLRNLQNALLYLARVRIIGLFYGWGWSQVTGQVWLGISVMARFRSQISKLRLRDFEIAQRIWQIAQIEKSRATLTPFV